MNHARLLQVIVAPHVSEKTSRISEKANQYVFEVASDASKIEVREAIEFVFKTKVKSVDIVTVKSKRKLFRGMEGKRKKWKKAYVTLQSDQAIDMMGAST